MKIKLIAAAVLALALGAAHAQTPETAPTPLPPVAVDPVVLAQDILDKSRASEQCRYAFTQKAVGDARVLWAMAAAQTEVRFDPRLPIGSRYTLVSATSQQKAIARSLVAEDKKAIATDLLALSTEGEFKITALAFVGAEQGLLRYSFKPEPILERSANEVGSKIIAQYEGELLIDSAAGRVIKVTVRAPPEGVKSGIAKIKSASFERSYALIDGKYVLTERVVQSVLAKALFSSAAINSGVLFGDFEPICDPAEVAKIVAAEAAAKTPN